MIHDRLDNGLFHSGLRSLAFLSGLLASLVLAAAPARGQSFLRAAGFGGPADDRGHAVATDADGNVALAGFFQDTADFDPGPGTFELTSEGGRDAVVVKLDGSGALLWAHGFGATEWDEARAVAFDETGNVYLAGGFRGAVDFDPGPEVFQLTAVCADSFLLKLNPQGEFGWVRQFSGSGCDTAWGIVFDDGGNVHVSGLSASTTDFDPGPGLFELPGGLYVVKLDADGDFVWAVQFDVNMPQPPRSLALDSAGNVFIAGSFIETIDLDPGPGQVVATGGCADAFVVKLTAAGSFEWGRSTLGAPCAGDIGFATEAAGIVVDDDGNAIAFGTFANVVDFDPAPTVLLLDSGDLGDTQAFAWKLDAEGDLAWAVQTTSVSGPGTGQAWVRAGALDGCGDLIVAGTLFGTVDFGPGPASLPAAATGQDLFLWRLGPDAEPLAVSVGEGTGTNHIGVDPSARSLLAGTYAGTRDFDPGPATASLTSAGGTDLVLQTWSRPVVSLTLTDALLRWQTPHCPAGYDVIRGDLAALRSSSGDFALATATCMADDLPFVSMASGDDPFPGAAWWYLVREVSALGRGTYDTLAASQVATRDAGIEQSGLGCP